MMLFPRSQRGFTILESLIMLVLLGVFSILAYGVLKSGVTQEPKEEDAEWLAKGGDSGVSSMAEFPRTETDVSMEQPGLGGGVVRDSETSSATRPPEE